MPVTPIGITKSGNTPQDFTSNGSFIGGDTTSSTSYSEYSYSIPGNYYNEQVWIAIQCISIDAWYLYVDAISLPALGFFEGFEEKGWPPSGWTHIQTHSVTWELTSQPVHSGNYSAVCPYDPDLAGQQDEWLISPTLDLTGYSQLNLTFWWAMSYYWAVTMDNYDCNVYISTDDGFTWNLLWNEDQIGEFTNWIWYPTYLDLSQYAGEQYVRIGFQYYGLDGADLVLDDITLTETSFGKEWVPFIVSANPGTKCEMLPKSRDTTGQHHASRRLSATRITIWDRLAPSCGMAVTPA